MCDFASAATATLQIGANYLGQRSQAKNAQQYMDAQARAAWAKRNFSVQNYEIERDDAYDAAVAEIAKTRMNALQLNSGVKAAVNENMSGRTANLLVRDVEGDTARTVARMQENYTRKSNEIDLNEETENRTLEETLKNINNSAPKMPSTVSNAISSAAIGLNAWTNYKSNSNKKKSGEG